MIPRRAQRSTLVGHGFIARRKIAVHAMIGGLAFGAPALYKPAKPDRLKR
jgi:hypothetical protein